MAKTTISTPPKRQAASEKEEARLAWLRAALIEGEKSGPARPHDAQAFLARMHAEYARGA